ncbi:MAG: YkgJ family cysteine cluster protein [Deltaproteobacteria bacterium]|nr:YkgJ family cysteine cluster protein [Deltaproteobacteria bacterium]
MGRRRRGTTAEPPPECRGCGGCCEAFGHTLAAEEGDLARWRREERWDLLAHVGEGGALWVDPVTGGDLDRCPFLERTGPGAARCAIHATKPDMCRDYPDSAHGFHCERGVRFRDRG